eukprot:2517523-Ditylum_brightwellii.AAC.1
MRAVFPAQSPNSGTKVVYTFSLISAIRYAELTSAANIFNPFCIAFSMMVLTDDVLTTPDHTSASGSPMVTLPFATSLALHRPSYFIPQALIRGTY